MQRFAALLATTLAVLALATPAVAQSQILCLQSPDGSQRACGPLERFLKKATLCRRSSDGTISDCRKVTRVS
jgi:hypothetical protein